MGQPGGMESVLRGRYRRIVFFFARVIASFIGWEVVGRRVGLGRLADRTRARRLRATAVRFRALAISMGGLMIKVGQFLSARLDVLPLRSLPSCRACRTRCPRRSSRPSAR